MRSARLALHLQESEPGTEKAPNVVRGSFWMISGGCLLTGSVTLRDVTPQTPVDQPFSLQQMAPRRSSRWVLWLVAGLVVLGLAGGGVSWWLLRDVPSGDSGSTLVGACQDAVRGKLIAPSTAKFPGGDRVEQEGSTWRVFGSVDAQNRFGAMLREDYRCVAVREGDGWDVYFVEVLD